MPCILISGEVKQPRGKRVAGRRKTFVDSTTHGAAAAARSRAHLPTAVLINTSRKGMACMRNTGNQQKWGLNGSNLQRCLTAPRGRRYQRRVADTSQASSPMIPSQLTTKPKPLLLDHHISPEVMAKLQSSLLRKPRGQAGRSRYTYVDQCTKHCSKQLKCPGKSRSSPNRRDVDRCAKLPKFACAGVAILWPQSSRR